MIDTLLADYKKPEDLIGEDGLLKQLTKALVERALNAKMTEHLGHLKHVFIACVDGLKGFPDAIATAFPHTNVEQLCLVHMVRNSLKFVSWKQRKEVAADMKAIYTSTTVEAGEQRLCEFEEKWGETLAPIGQSWRRNWAQSIPFSSYPPEIGKVIYTTNTIEPIIGHLKNDHRMQRNYLKGQIGDTVNLFMACAAFNFRKFIRILCFLYLKFLGHVFRPNVQPAHACA